MSFSRIAGPSRGKQTPNRAPAQSSGSVKGSDPMSANKGISPVKETFINKVSPRSGNLKDRDTVGRKGFTNPDDPG